MKEEITKIEHVILQALMDRGGAMWTWDLARIIQAGYPIEQNEHHLIRLAMDGLVCQGRMKQKSYLSPGGTVMCLWQLNAQRQF